MRLIDADALIARLKKDPLFRLVEQYGITGVIEAEPTIDAVPVVRCKDCKYITYYYCTCPHWDSDQYIYPEVDENDFCSYGERRIDNA